MSAFHALHARHFLAGFVADITPSREPVLTWLAREYTPRKIAQGLRPSTLAAYARDLAFADDFCRLHLRRPLTFADLTDAFRESFFLWRRDRVGLMTAARGVRHLEAVWRDAAARQPPLCLPPGRRATCKVDERAPDAWWPEELQRLRAAARACPWDWFRPRFGGAAAAWSPPPFPPALFLSALIELTLNTAARKDAILTTPTANLDLQRRVIMIPASRQKHRRSQAIVLKPATCELWRQLDLHGRGVPTLGGDWPYDRHGHWKTLDGWLARIVRAANLVPADEPIRRHLWHKLRRTAATYVARASGIAAAQRLCGHSTPAVLIAHYLDQRMLGDIDMSGDVVPDFDCATARGASG